MKLLFKRAGILSLMILAISFLGCEDDDDANGLPEVVAAFTQTQIEDSGVVSFINISENADSFEWDFGDGTTSTEIDPIKTFVSGTFKVTLTASNSAGASDTFEDEITISIPEPPTPLTLPIDFDGTDVDYDIIVGDNIGFTVETNPENGNGNDTNVGQMVAGGGQFQNVQFPIGPAVDFSGANKTIQLELFASTEIAVLVKFEDGADGARDVEVGVTHTGSGWETLTFDFAATAVASFIEGDSQNGQPIVPDGQFSKMILFIGFNTDPGVEGTFYVDNIVQTESDPGGGSGGGGSLDDCGGDLVNDFETDDDSIFSNFGGGVGTIIDNPDTSVNTSAKVGQYVKGDGADFAGITIEVDPDIDFDSGVFSIDVYSQAVRQLLFKLEGLNIEVIVPTSGTGWETITYDFSAIGGNVGSATAITLIMDNGTVGDGSADWTIQFDNIRLCSNNSGGGGSCPAPPGGELLSNGGFEANSGDGACWQLNAGGGSVTIIDTDADVGTYSAQMITGPSQVPNLKQERFAPTISGSQDVQVTFRYKINSAFVDGSILQVLAFSERSGGVGAVAHDLGNADTSTVGSWQTYTGSFTTDAGTDEGISLLIQATCGGAATCAGEVVIDEVVVVEL